jgi:NCS1 family nucleobase:cation symporter-1
VLIADYWLLRRRELDLPALFDPAGRYAYEYGVNWRALTALVIAVLPVLPGFLHAAMTPGGQIAAPTLLDSLYTYAWFVTFAISSILYLLLMAGQKR